MASLRRSWGKLRWRVATRLSSRVRLEGAPPLTTILLSYRRPGNMSPLARAVLRCAFVDRVIICNNNPEVDLAEWIPPAHPRIEIRSRATRGLPGTRFEVARDTPAEHFLCIDDDCCLYPRQIARLYERYLEDPTVPHGAIGKIIRRAADSDRTGFEPRKRHEGRIDLLNCVYIFSRAHVTEYFRLLRELGVAGSDELGFRDDIVLSYCGQDRPRSHDVGRIAMCTSAHDRDIAVFRQPGFDEHRHELLKRLQKLKPFGR